MTSYQEHLSRLVADLGLTGASFAYWDGEISHLAAAGPRNSLTGDPVTTDTVMHIGSITKITNTVPMLQLVDDGLVKLDDPVVKLPAHLLRRLPPRSSRRTSASSATT